MKEVVRSKYYGSAEKIKLLEGTDYISSDRRFIKVEYMPSALEHCH